MIFYVLERDINQAVKHHVFTGHGAESWPSQEERVAQVSALPKPCLLHPSPIFTYNITTSPLLYDSLQKYQSDQAPGIQVFGLIPPERFWNESASVLPPLYHTS